MAYALVEELRQVLDIPPEDTSNDVDLQRALDAGAQWIEWVTGRTFTTSAAVQAKTGAATTYDVVPLVDLQDAAPLVEVDTDGDRTFATALLPAQYQLEPLSGPPFDTLRAWPTPPTGTDPVCFEPGQLVTLNRTDPPAIEAL